METNVKVMSREEVRKNLIQSFVMLEFASDRLETEQEVARMLNLIEKKLNISNTDAKSFFRESIGICNA